ncbi:MAG TPA: beta-galactosidase [Burkholderiaceae bacterium]|jgi:hypothetical protein
MNKYWKLALLQAGLVATALACGATETAGVNVLHVDASAPAIAPQSGYFHMGTAAAPNGARLDINSQYLTRDGSPWLPVMGEFHYSRSPAASWEAELYKMKSAGVNVVSSYVIWSHHEADEGKFNWSDNRDLHRFVQLCGKIGLNVIVRVGPWAHAEVRYGGMPDWVVDKMPTRRDDPEYLGHVSRLYQQIGAQLQGQLWKQGGPVIGIQLENEYNLEGVSQGAQHIKTLKALARQAGLDVPLYTVTGWDGTVYPSGEVTPVFGGYPDEPWGTSTSELPPKETYAFRFGSRVSGDLGAQTAASTQGTADIDGARVPFLGAEYGAGLPAMYRRRTLVTPDDIASMLPVQLGSGLNMVGYYMFHGGRNPTGRTSLEESSLSGGYNDTPKISYDFQAPLGPDGQQRPVLEKLKPIHYFLNDFGARLAPMTVRKPEHAAVDPTDLTTPRWSVRSSGNSGFVFFNNHVRQYGMAQQHGVQFSIGLPEQKLVFPAKALDVPDGSYFIWPFNFDLDGTLLRYATALPVARLDEGKEGVIYVFAASEGIPVELGFNADVAGSINAPGATFVKGDGTVTLQQLQPGLGGAVSLRQAGGRKITLIILTSEQARHLTISESHGKRRLAISEQEAWYTKDQLQLRSVGQGSVRAAIFPAIRKIPAPFSEVGSEGLFQILQARLPEHHIDIHVTPDRPALDAPAVMRGGLAQAALQPLPESFRNAASWHIVVSPQQLKDLDEAYLQIDFVGDIGRLFSGTRMIDDWYYGIGTWQVGMKYAELKSGEPLSLSVMPLRADAPIYLSKESRPNFEGQAQIAWLRGVNLIPVYRFALELD